MHFLHLPITYTKYLHICSYFQEKVSLYFRNYGYNCIAFLYFLYCTEKKDPLPRTLFQNTTPRKNYFPSIDYDTIFFSIELTVKSSWLLEKNKTQMGKQNGRSNSFTLDGRRSLSTSTLSSLATYFVSLLNCTPVADWSETLQKNFLLNGIENEFKYQLLHHMMSACLYRFEVWQSLRIFN